MRPAGINNCMACLTLVAIATLATALLPFTVVGGSLDNPGSPSSGSGMPTSTDIYNQLDTGVAAAAASSFKEPAAGPTAGTGKSLSDIKAKLPIKDTSNGATPGEVLSGKSFWGLGSSWGQRSGAMPNNGAASFTPGAAAVPVPAGYYSGGQVNTDAALVSGNIKSGATVFGVSGKTEVVDTTEAIAPAAAANISVGKKAFVNGTLVTGTFISPLAKRVNKTGQTTIYEAGDDGQYQYGINPVIAPSTGSTGGYNTPATTGTRFIDNGDGTVTDLITALVWLRDASCLGFQKWTDALTLANTLASPSAVCSLSDGSTAGQWRLPNINELHSLGPNWPPGAPFSSVRAFWYWSSSTNADYPSNAWGVDMVDGYVSYYDKTYLSYVWSVRSGQ